MLERAEAVRIIEGYAPPYSAMQIALRRAYGVTTRKRAREGGRKLRARGPRRRDVLDCMRQRHGASVDV